MPCITCGGGLSTTNDLWESMKWTMNPPGMIVNGIYSAIALGKGYSDFNQKRCRKCDTYYVYCSKCEETTPISSRKRHIDMHKCSNCGALGRIRAV